MAKYDYVATNIKTVMENIDEYVIPENQRIIEYLWDMNIITTHTNNYDNDFSWVAIGELSEENKKVFWERANKDSILDERLYPKFTLFSAFSIPVKPGTKDTFDDFKSLVDLLKPQDVQKDGYMSIEEFYINCTDCWKIIDNPCYGTILEPQYENYSDIHEYQKAYEIYNSSLTRRIKVIDESKITRPLEEYLEEAGYSGCYDALEGKIFYTRRLYEGHMRYKNNEEKHL